MTAIDWILVLPMAYGAVRGGFNGLINEFASLIALVAGLYVAFRFSDPIHALLLEQMEITGSEVKVAVFVVLFIVTAAAVHLAGRSLTKAAKWAALGWLNRALGAFFGLLKYCLVTIVLVQFFARINGSAGMVAEEDLAESILYPKFLNAGNTLFPAWENWRHQVEEDVLFKDSVNTGE